MALPKCCPLCSANGNEQSVVTSHVYGGEDSAIFRCGSCDLRYLHPGLPAEEEAKFYAKEFESFMANRSADGAGWEQPERHIAANEAQRSRRMGHLSKFLESPKRVLEIGCSSGFMLHPLMEKGFDCVGVEPSGVFADYVRSRGITCFDSLEELERSEQAAGGFDLILHYYVMEHVADPAEFLRKQIGLLREGGTIIFEVPHANDALAALYDVSAYERFIWVISHRWYFGRKSLELLIRKSGGAGQVGFDQRYDLSNHLIWLRDGKPGGMGRFTGTLGQGVEDSYRKALIDAGYADTLIGVVRKS